MWCRGPVLPFLTVSAPSLPSRQIGRLGQRRLLGSVRNIDAFLARAQRPHDDSADVISAVRHHAGPRILTRLVPTTTEFGGSDGGQHQ